MLKESTVYFHLGLPKTGSTYLQAKVFPKMPKIKYFRKYYYNKYRNLNPRDGEKYFFTCEMDVTLFEEMDSIKRKFPDNAFIIVVFRKHFSWIISKYKNHIRKFGWIKFKKFFSPGEEGLLDISRHFYSELADAFFEKFGDRVLLLNYDELKESPGSFVRKIYDFLDLPDEDIVYSRAVVKRSFSNNQLKILRNFNNFYRYDAIRTKYHIINWVHYKYRHLLLHTVAFFARFIPVRTADFQNELLEDKETIENYFQEDWDNMLQKFA